MSLDSTAALLDKPDDDTSKKHSPRLKPEKVISDCITGSRKSQCSTINKVYMAMETRVFKMCLTIMLSSDSLLLVCKPMGVAIIATI